MKIRTVGLSGENGEEIANALRDFGLKVYVQDTGCSDKHGGYYLLIISDVDLSDEQIEEIEQYPPNCSDYSECVKDEKDMFFGFDIG